jgi:alpha-tubulin suppressor-like RCC1 family protein
MQSGTVKCWGANASGQLGNGTTVASLTPVDVGGLSEVRALSMSGAFACALLASGSVKCWGSNSSGQLGDGTLIDRSAPVDVGLGGAKVRALSTGEAHACAVTESGALLCWGSNSNGQLGDGTLDSHAAPTPVAALGSDVDAVSAGWRYTCAKLKNGALKCWGWNLHQQVGDATTVDRPNPTDVLTLGPGSGIAAFSTGRKNTCVFTMLGKLKCWGYNDTGAVGDGTNIERGTPTDVIGF